MFIGVSLHIFREKIPNGNVEFEVSLTCYTPLQYVIKLTPAKIRSNFPLFLLPRKFLQTFSNSCKALLLVEFNFVLKSCPSNSCVICGFLLHSTLFQKSVLIISLVITCALRVTWPRHDYITLTCQNCYIIHFHK
jgi:RNase P subunit RPR2